MRRLLTWLVVTLGIAEIVRRLRRRGQRGAEAELAPPRPEDDPADELRRKLADSRSEDELAEPPTSPPEATVEERRAEVHDEGRSALDEMREPSDES